MTTNDEILQAKLAAQIALLQAIKAKAGEVAYSGTVSHWAEAFAWLASPDQPHG